MYKRFLVLLGLASLLAASLASIALALPNIPAGKFMEAQGCGCHAALLEQWSTTMHSKALQDPLYKLKRDEANKATGGTLGIFCDECHGPVAVMSGEIAKLDSASAQSREGIGCDFCHQVNGTESPLGNTSATMETDKGKHAQFKDAVSPAHDTLYSSFHESAEFCGTCHNVDHPGNGMHLEATYTEWKAGPYAEEGIVCQDCHMTPGPGVTKPNPGKAAAGGPQRDHIYTMTFVGGNVGLGNAELAEERLKAAATLDLEAPEIVAPGEKAEVAVTITNSGAGHKLPTGLTEVREMWLEVTALDQTGKSTLVGKHVFGTVLKDAAGKYPVELWEAVAFQSDDRIPPKESVTDRFEFTMPSDGEVELKATLYYRSCTEDMAAKAGVEIPTTIMAETVQASYSSEQARAEANRVEPGQGGDQGGVGSLIWALAGMALGGGAVAFFILRGRRAN